MFKGILSREEFLEWYTDVPQYVFEEGQEPNIRRIIEKTKNRGDLEYEIDEKTQKLREKYSKFFNEEGFKVADTLSIKLDEIKNQNEKANSLEK